MTLEQAHQTKLDIMQLNGESAEPDAGGMVLPRKNSKSPRASFARTSTLQNKAEMMLAHKEASEIEKRIIEDDRKRAEEDLIKKGVDSTQTIIMPQYKEDARLKVDREINPPPKNMYIGLGWDEDKTTLRKHYRMYFNDELENNTDIFPQKSPFHSYELQRGQSRGLKKGGFMSMFKKPQKQDASG
mmetsp:Transcript_30294/g.46317  ORF Transcript_30294/g.46317 Transcript_30294/m.46317 type:complete len:186 (+) Transcript_30294:2929-3486(+)